MIHYVNKEGRMDNYISDVETLLHRLKDSDISSGTCKSDGAKKSNLSSRSYVQTVIDSIDDPTVILDRDYRVLFMNKRMKETSAWADFSKPVLFCYEVFQDSTKPCCGKSRPCPLSSVVKNRAPVATRHSYHDGLYNKKFTDVVATPVFDEAGEVCHIIETYKDVSDYSEFETSLRESEMLYRSLFDQSGDAILILQGESSDIGKILSANNAACTMLGYSKEELLRLYITDLDTPEHAAKAPKRIKSILEGETLRLEITHKKKDGTTLPVEVSASRMNMGNKKLVLATYRNISKRKQAEEERDRLITELKHISRTDGLTGLLNRQYLDKRLDEEIRRAKRYGNPLTIIMFDIDYFKIINDTFGHITGDKILQKTSSIIKEEIRNTDVAGRFGGDEFMIILVQTDITVGMQVADRLSSRIRQHRIKVNEYDTTGYSISTGICEYDDAMGSVEEFINKADMALYDAKRSRKKKKD
jgi:diguanylate cyclase (GGDEF)-like protein/PAS domain S-box-containing protein